MYLVDSHCHLDRLKLDVYDGNLEKALDAARQRGVGRFLCVGIDMQNADAVIALSEKYDDVYASVGVHPLSLEHPAPKPQELLALAQHPKVIAVGEMGLDFFYDKDNHEEQERRFISQLEVAAECRKPVIIHTRDARQKTLELLEAHCNLEVGGILHCFTESLEMAQAALEMNFYVSISGIVTFRNASELRDTVKALPLDRLLVETDAPYLAPVPHRGKPNEPAFVRDVAEFVAELKGVSYEELMVATTENFNRLMHLPE
ncbi:TatD family hydrolase [Litoribacillus peritrichatus]|uniref:TatD family hydrolase n=1 Tax=Litoribacillus peritrichatus TaxID=718191 RepID=A0ABP7N3A2_9GAMM